MTDRQNSATLQFASALSVHPDWERASAEVCDAIAAKLDRCDVAFVFASADHSESVEQFGASLSQRLGTRNVIGCTGESIAGVGREVERSPALSVCAASLPQVDVRTMHLRYEQAPEGGAIVGWPDDLPDQWQGASLVLLGDPYSFPVDALLARLNEDHPGVPIVGGMASSATAPGENRLLFGSQVVDEGAVAVMLRGPIRLRTVVSQGCRPIGKHFVVTSAEKNVIRELGGKAALLQLKELFDTLPTREQNLVQQGLHVGRVVNPYQDRFEQGDFLVRNAMGVDPDSGAIAIGDLVRAGQTVQFHIRDQQTADQELRQLLAVVRDEEDASPCGGLLFTCNGRGTRLFEQPHHDAVAIQSSLGDIPLAGFFAAGEIGPIGGQNFLHGFTASIALFEPVTK